jgi:hypothetical protein
MPSDERVQLALRALAGRRDVYRAAVTSALARARGMLAVGGGVERARQELGALGATRIDPARFADLSHAVALDAMARTRIERAEEILRNSADAADAEFVVHVVEGSTPHAAIASALNRWGRAFGSSIAVDLVRLGQYVPALHDLLTKVWRFERWSRAHRLAAPPIVAVVPGSHFRVADLSEFLDGALHIALVVEGDCPPAALARHITPGTLVLQTSDEKGLDRFAAYGGPAIAALVPDTAACFLHDPEAGAAPWQRLSIWGRPANRPRVLGEFSAAQQREELLQLEAIAAQPSLPNTAIEALAPAGAGDPADRLASWLLAQSGAGEPT